MAVSLGVDRLFICPELNQRIGKAAFDGFIFVRQSTTLFSNIAGNGFRLHFVRNLVGFSTAEKRLRFRTAATLICLIVGVGFPVVVMATVGFAPAQAQSNAIEIYVPFGIFGLARALELVISVNLQVKRQFEKLFALRLLEGGTLVALFLIIPSPTLGIVGVMYAASLVIPLMLNVYFNRDIVAPGKLIDRPTARVLVRAAPPGAMLAGFETAQTLLPSLFLGAIGTGDGRLGVLFAAMSMANLFNSPVGLLSQLVLSLLSGKRDFDLNARRGFLYLSVTFALAAITALAAYGLGRVLVYWRYPQEYAEVVTFYHWIAAAIGCLAVRGMLKPFAVKYLPMRSVVIISAAPLTVLVVCLVALIPAHQTAGAAVALAISSVISMMCWIGAFEILRRGKSAASESDNPAVMDDI